MQRVDSGLQAGKSWRNPFDAASLRDLAGTEVRCTSECIKVHPCCKFLPS